MALTPSSVTALLRTPEGRKMFRYTMASVVSVIVSVVLLVIFKGLFAWGAVLSSTLATAIATIPSYQMNRRWAWGKSGKGHLWREVVPFWVLAFIGWAFSTYAVQLTDGALKGSSLGHATQTAALAGVYLGAFGVLWIAKFVVFNRVLFVDRPEELPASLDGRTGIPG